MVTWLRLVGWDAQQLAGGYKTWRRHVLQQLETLPPQLDLHVLCGPTGSAKTRVLQALAAQGAQVLDLEALAQHRGSVLGALPGVAQPTQTAFETRLAHALQGLDTRRPVFIEAESARIGCLNVPQPLVQRLRASPCIEVQASAPARLDFLLRDYAHLGDDPALLAERIATLKELHGKQVIARWQAWAQERALAPLFAELMALHYDPLYARSQNAHLYQWPQRRTVSAQALTPAHIDTLARQILALEADARAISAPRAACAGAGPARA
jgi:tRNA 2-selenouridine synthase